MRNYGDGPAYSDCKIADAGALSVKPAAGRQYSELSCRHFLFDKPANVGVPL